jgi:hypothetical protein
MPWRLFFVAFAFQSALVRPRGLVLVSHFVISSPLFIVRPSFANWSCQSQPAAHLGRGYLATQLDCVSIFKRNKLLA